jgi:hypothetical protein
MRVAFAWRWLRWAAAGALLLLLLAQLVPVERTNPPVTSDIDVSDEVRSILRRSCYDCHSHETRWPWYSFVAPMSWYVIDHVDHGRGDLNFSEWPTFDFEAQDLAFEDIREQLEKGEMPLTSYLLLHPSARLSEDDRQLLLRWSAGP